MTICRPWCASSVSSTMAALHCGQSRVSVVGFSCRRLLRRLYFQNDRVRFVGRDVEEAVTALLHIPDSPAQVAEQRFPSQFLVVLVDQDPIEASRPGNLAVAHPADEDIALPLRQTIAGVEADARHGNCGHPVDDRIAEAFLRERALPGTTISTPEADLRPAVIATRHEDVHLVAAIRSVLDLPDGAGDRMLRH